MDSLGWLFKIFLPSDLIKHTEGWVLSACSYCLGIYVYPKLSTGKTKPIHTSSVSYSCFLYALLFDSLWINAVFFTKYDIFTSLFKLVIYINDQGEINKNSSSVFLTIVIPRRKLNCLSPNTFETRKGSYLSSFLVACHLWPIRTHKKPVIVFGIDRLLCYDFKIIYTI